MSIRSTREVLDRYFSGGHAGDEALADDVEFTVMGTGMKHSGPEGVGQMLNYFYSQAFEATAERTNLVVGNGKAVLEANFVGKHIGNFAGIPATGKDVNVPLCVVYEIKDGKIWRGSVYLEMPVMLKQLGTSMGGG